MLKEFKTFLFRGNVIDLAVAVVIGAAFIAIVNSLVKDVIMPVIGLLLAGVDLAALKIVLKPEVIERYLDKEVITPEVAINIGLFINAVIQFVIVATVIFLIVKGINKLQSLSKKKKEEVAVAPKPDDIRLLEEIRDLLKKQR